MAQASITVLIRDGEHLKRLTDQLPSWAPYAVYETAEQANEAAKHASGDFLLLLDHSDQIEEGQIQTLGGWSHDVDVVYPTIEDANGDTLPAQAYDELRLKLENYLPGIALIRRDKFPGLRDEGDLTGYAFWLDCRGLRHKACWVALATVSSWPRQPTPEEALRLAGEEVEVKGTFYYQATPATTYLRCTLPARYLPAITANDIGYMQSDEDYWFPYHRGGAAVLQFAGDKTWAAFTHGFQAKGIRVLVEVDDNYLVRPGGHMSRNSGWGRKIGGERHTIEGHKYIVQWADGMIVTTEELGKKYRRAYDKTIYVCPNQIDPTDWPDPPARDDGVLRIGWFASLSHAQDAKLVQRGLEWASKQKDVEVYTMWVNPTWWTFDRYHIEGVADLAYYRAAMGTLDVGVAPVIPNVWSSCRSDVKALEYSMGGALSILSNVPSYSWWHDKPALMAGSGKDFYHHIRWCVENRDEVKRLAAEAKALVLKERTAQGNAWRWEEALSG